MSDTKYIELSGSEHRNDVVCIQVYKGLVTPKYEFGLGLSLNDRNVVLKVDKHGQIYNEYKNIITPGMKIESINESLVGIGDINTTNTLRQQHTKVYNIYFSKPKKYSL